MFFLPSLSETARRELIVTFFAACLALAVGGLFLAIPLATHLLPHWGGALADASVLPIAFFCVGCAAAMALGRREAIFYALAVLLLNLPALFFWSFDRDYFIFTTLWPLLGLVAAKKSAGWRSASLFIGFVFVFLGASFIGLNSYELGVSGSLGPAQILAVFETNRAETLAYMKIYPLLWLAVGALPLAALGWFVAARRGVFHRGALSPDLLTLIVTFLFLAILSTPVGTKVYYIGVALFNYDEHAFAYRKALPERLAHLDLLGAKNASDAIRGPTIVVIGESANRNHWHLYGYRRATTPGIEALDPQSYVAFRDVIASYCGTTYSLSAALTTASVDNKLHYYDPGVSSVMEILRAAGRPVVWLSNQAEHGLWNQTITDLAASANRVWFTMRDERGTGATSLLDTFSSLKRPYDDVLLPEIEKTLASTPGSPVIFVHLMGSHSEYEQRYPQAFAQLSAAKEQLPPLANGINWAFVDSYDNSILYTDAFLSKLIAMLDERKGESALLYFSDHGESPLLGLPHDPARFSSGNVDVPFLFWGSSAFRARHKTLMQTARAHKDAPYMMDHLDQTLFDLTGVKGPFLRPSESLLSAAFKPIDRWTLNGDIHYEAIFMHYCQEVLTKTGYALGACEKMK